MLDLKLLADAATIFLAPALPYLLKLSGKAAEQAAEKLGGEAWEKAKAVWGRIAGKVEAKPVAQAAAGELAAAPGDEDARAAFRLQVRKLLEADPELAAELEKLVGPAAGGTSYHAEVHGSGAVAQGPGAAAAGAGGIAIGGGASGVRIGGFGPRGEGDEGG